MDALYKKYRSELVNALKEHLTSGRSSEIDPQLFTAPISDSTSLEEVINLLEAAAKIGLIDVSDVFICPVEDCSLPLSDDDLSNNLCSRCNTDYNETGDTPTQKRLYLTKGNKSRDITWLIAVHGFNTTGVWQENFSWRIANKIKYSAPVFIYKYGLIRFSVLFHWRHIMLAKQLGFQIRNAVKFAGEHGINEPPDIVIHSFGGQLFVTLLGLKEFSDLKFGRVIATGSIVHPDYDWGKEITDGRIEAIFNHCGGKDCALPFTQFFIPDTGPSGKYGFSDKKVLNTLNADYGHSSYFKDEALTINLKEGGLWDLFLKNTLSPSNDSFFSHEPTEWWSAPRPIKFLTRIIMIILCIVMMAIMLISLLYGLIKMVPIIWQFIETLL